MNVRLSNNKVRFKVSETELQILRTTGLLSESLQFSDEQLFNYKILIDNDTQYMRLDFSTKGLVLFLAPDIIDINNSSASNTLLSKEGLSMHSGSLKLCFQVDVLSKAGKHVHC